jgi:hypothetical protein
VNIFETFDDLYLDDFILLLFLTVAEEEEIVPFSTEFSFCDKAVSLFSTLFSSLLTIGVAIIGDVCFGFEKQSLQNIVPLLPLCQIIDCVAPHVSHTGFILSNAIYTLTELEFS